MDENNPAVVRVPTLKTASVEQLMDELCFRGEAFVGAIYQYHAGKKDPSYTAWRCIGPSTLTMGLVRNLERAAGNSADAEEWETNLDEVETEEEEEEEDEDAESV